MKPIGFRMHKHLSGLALAAALAATACGGQPTSTDDVGAVGSAEAALTNPMPSETRLDAITEVLRSVTLTPSQKAHVDALTAAAQARHASVKTADDALRIAIAGEVRAGKIDRVLLSPELRALSTAATAAHRADLAALVTLHDLLDEAQRNQFIDALEARHGARTHRRHFNRRWFGFWGKFLDFDGSAAFGDSGDLREHLRGRRRGQPRALPSAVRRSRLTRGVSRADLRNCKCHRSAFQRRKTCRIQARSPRCGRPGVDRLAAHEAGRKNSAREGESLARVAGSFDMPREETEWVRLPGLFRWQEVCEVFAATAGCDDDWRFAVRLAIRQSKTEALYVVFAASGGERAEHRRAG